MSSSTSMVAAAENIVSAPRALDIDVFFNFGCGHCQNYRQHPSGGPSLTSSSTLMVATAGNTDSTPRGPPLMSFSTSVVVAAENTDNTAQGHAINVFFNFSGGRCWKYRQHPQRACHQRLLQLQWWPLLKIPTAPSRGSVIDVFFNFSGDHCRKYRQLPQGARYRRLQLRWWLLPEISTAPPGGLLSISSSFSVVAAAGLGSIPYLSSPASGSPTGAALRVGHT
jgi:hypothetical protein